MSDFLDDLSKCLLAFRKHNLSPPASILLSSHDEGMLLLGELIQKSAWSFQVGDERLGEPVLMMDGTYWMEMKLLGVKIRWPANKYENSDGTYSWS